MAAAFTKDNGDYLKSKFGRMPSPGEPLYRTLSWAAGRRENVRRRPAGSRPDRGRAVPEGGRCQSPTIFYDHGQPRTIRQVYKALVAQHEGPSALDPGYAVQQMMAGQRQPTVNPDQVVVTYPVPLAPLVSTGGNSRPVTVNADAASRRSVPASGPPTSISTRCSRPSPRRPCNRRCWRRWDRRSLRRSPSPLQACGARAGCILHPALRPAIAVAGAADSGA